MVHREWVVSVSILACLIFSKASYADETPIKEDWDYAPAMKEIAAGFKGHAGTVIHVGDSITYANPYSAWARAGKGQSEADRAALKWMHAGADNDSDGWYLARFDHPDGGRSYTACGGIRVDEMLAGGKQKMPPLDKLLEMYQPQAVVLMLGTNDCSAGRGFDQYLSDVNAAVDLILKRHCVCILSTIPPHVGRLELSAKFNAGLRGIAREKKLPLIDFEREILSRRPNDWDGTLLGKGDVHPTAEQGGARPNSAPTAENLRNSGYLLRGWLSVEKISEVKARVFDDVPKLRNAESAAASEPAVTPPVGDAVRVAVSRDTWLSAVNSERVGSNGGAKQIKLKSIQEFPLLDVATTPLKGRVINAATLHLHQAGKEQIYRVTVGTVAMPWVEGDATGYAALNGASTFAAARHPDVAWANPGSDVLSVVLSGGGTLWRMAEAFPPDASGWQKVAVDPAVIAARIAGVSEGFILFDDTGSEWTRDGDRFNLQHFPNRFFHSRESGPATAPFFTVYLGARDSDPPDAPTQLAFDVADLPGGEARVSWLTPADHGAAGTIGFFVAADGNPVPRYLIPRAAAPGGKVTMHLRDLGWKPGQAVNLKVGAVDGAGNRGPAASIEIHASASVDGPIPGSPPAAPKPAGSKLLTVAGSEIAIIDALDKVQSSTGQMIPPQPGGYLAANHLWNASEKKIRLHGARNEFVSFQILTRGDRLIQPPKLQFDGTTTPIRSRFFACRDVESSAGPVPDPLVPIENAAAFEGATGKSHSLICEIYIPHDQPAGELTGALELSADCTIAVSLTVWDFTLPDSLSFIAEMNCYGLPSNDRDYYRLAHENRTVLNRVPYHHSGAVDDGFAPRWDGKALDWAAWDRRWAPYFDGSAFEDLPRKGVALECFYLPLFENWPTPMEGNYNGDYWADRAFPKRYRDAFVEVSRQMAEHFAKEKWGRTLFQCFFNGKNNFKAGGWSRGTSPWLLDEPANFQDFWALRYFGEAFHEGVNLAPVGAKMMFRCDISRPEYQRNALDHLLDYNVVAGGAFDEHRRMVLDRKQENGQILILYGTTNDPAASNMQAVGWCLDAWTQGADGVLPWQTIGSSKSWEKADALSLFYPGDPVGSKTPLPSIRLKAYLRGEQDVEYLVLLSKLEKQSQLQIGRRVRAAMRDVLQGVRAGTGFTGGEDAGVINFDKLRPQDAWALRVQIGQILSAAKPAPAERLVDFQTPRRDPKNAAPAYVTVGEIPPAPTPPFQTVNQK